MLGQRSGELQPASVPDGSTASALAVTAITNAELVARDLVDLLSAAVGIIGTTPIGRESPLDSLLATARRVADSAAAARGSLGDAVNAKAALIAAAAETTAGAHRTDARLTHELLHDSLTGLPNRRLLLDRLTHALARSSRFGTFVAVLFIDLDQHGDPDADQLLVSVARRLGECIRDSDTFGRVGGDEFVVILEDMADPSEASQLRTRLGEELADGVPVADTNVPVYASMGVAVSSPGSLPADLLAEADIAMYTDKASARQSRPRLTLQGESADPSGKGRVVDPPHARRRTDQP